MENVECFGAGSVAGAVIGTFLTTILLLVVAAFLYRQWKRHKGKHLVLVTDPEIVDEAYAFDNPCFKDATPATGRSLERAVPQLSTESSNAKDSTKWSAPWSSLGLSSLNRTDKRRTLDDSCLGPKAKRVNIVGLKSRDFTGLGFNVCGNMREGIFVKDLLHRGPASESGLIHPGDRIASVKISFRSMVYEDALTILSYASPYDVELEVETGGTGSKPTTLLKKSVGPTPARICHPLYRSQSIPEFSQNNKNAAKRLFMSDPNESLGSNYSTLNSTLKSSKSTPGNQTLERRHEEAKGTYHQLHHHKFGIKVLPALDGTVHRIENQNEHNTNLERRHSKKLDADKFTRTSTVPDAQEKSKLIAESFQLRENQRQNGAVPRKILRLDGTELNGIDVPDRGKVNSPCEIPSEVPAEVHNAAMAARRNRKSNSELLTVPTSDPLDADGDAKSPQKNKRKAPAPPKVDVDDDKRVQTVFDDKLDSITDYAEAIIETKPVEKEQKEEIPVEEGRKRLLEVPRIANRRNSESDTDSEVQNNFTTIELNSADITIHHTPVPPVDDDDDVYRKAASLGDLSKYENKASNTLERAQSLDMTDTGSKKRKAPLPPEDIHESTEDLSKLDQIDVFDKRKLKKSNEWGTLEDAIWSKDESSEDEILRIRKKSNGTLERSKSSVEIKLKEGATEERLNVSDGARESGMDLFNLPLSLKLTRDFITAERLFDPAEDNALSRIVHDGRVVKSETPEHIESELRKQHPIPEDSDKEVSPKDEDSSSMKDGFEKALRYFDLHTGISQSPSELKVDLDKGDESDLYAGKKEVVEEPITKVTLDFGCPGCDHRHGHHEEKCSHKNPKTEISYLQTIRVEDPNVEEREPEIYETHYAKRILNVPDAKVKETDDGLDEEDGYEFGSITVNNKTVPEERHHNVSNVSVSSGENSEDSGLVRESSDFERPPKIQTYITEIKVSTSREEVAEPESDNEEIVAIMEGKKADVTVTSNGKPPVGKKPPVPPRRSDAARLVKDEVPEKQVVYVSEYKATKKETPDKDGSKKYENWIFLGDKNEQNPWENGSSPSQPVTNIVLSSGDEKVVHK